MKLLQSILTLILCSALAATARNLDEVPSIAGSGVDRTADKVFLRDASVSAGGGATRWMNISDLVNVPGLFASVPDGTFAIAKTTGLQAALDSKQATLISGNNVKTLNGSSILGSGDLTVSGGLPSDGSSSTLRTARVLGSTRITEGNRAALSRWWMLRERKGRQLPGVQDTNRIRVVDYGDSMTVPFGRALSKQLGYGGSFRNLNTNNSTDISSQGASTGDQWTRTLSGSVHRLTNAQVLTYLPTTPMTGIWVQYLAKSGNGSIQLSYQTNKTGSYTTSTNNWVIESLPRYTWGFNGSSAVLCTDSTGIEAGMTVTGSGVQAGTTVTSVAEDVTVSTTASTTNGSSTITVASVAGISMGMRVETSIGQGLFVSSINPGASQVTLTDVITSNGTSVPFSFRGKRVILSAALTSNINTNLTFSRSDAGSSTGGTGTLNTNNAGAEKFCTAFIAVPNFTSGPDYYNIRLTATGTVDLCGIGVECGGFGQALDANSIAPGGVLYGNYGEGGKRVNDHFNLVPSDVWNRALGYINPDIITFKGLNDWGISTLTAEVSPGVTVWDQFMGKIHAAAPNALVLVFSSSITYLFPLPDQSGYALMDDWMRDWCAKSGFAVFVETRQNSLAHSQIQGDLQNLSSDGLHQYGTGNDIRGLGEEWSASMALQTVMPVLQTTGPYSSRNKSNNNNRPLPGDINRIPLGTPDSSGTGPTYSPLFVDLPPRSRGAVLLRAAESANTTNTYGSTLVAGYAFAPWGGGSGTNPGSLSLISAGNEVVAFGNNHFSGQAPFGALFGAWAGNTVSDTRRSNGWRFLQPTTIYGQKPGLVAESRSGCTAATLAVASGASETVEGINQYEWFAESGNRVEPKTIVATGTTGAQTINRVTGRVNFAAGASSLVVTNNLVTANSIILITKATNDSTARLGAAVASAGSFTIHMDVAPAAECAVNFSISN